MLFVGDIQLYDGENVEDFTAAQILYENGFDSYVYADSYDVLFTTTETKYLAITGIATKQLVEKIKNSNALYGVKIII